ncbi:hypothetical protein [Oceanithermus sp.]
MNPAPSPVQSSRTVGRTLRLLWRVSPLEVTALVLLLVFQGALPVLAIAISRNVVDGLATGGPAPLVWALAWAGVLLVGGDPDFALVLMRLHFWVALAYTLSDKAPRA